MRGQDLVLERIKSLYHGEWQRDLRPFCRKPAPPLLSALVFLSYSLHTHWGILPSSLPSGSHLNMHKSREFVKYICACVNFCQLVGIFAPRLPRLLVSQCIAQACLLCMSQNLKMEKMLTWIEVNLGMWQMKCRFSLVTYQNQMTGDNKPSSMRLRPEVIGVC